MPDQDERSYLFVAIDRATRWVYMNIYPDQTEKSSVSFVDEVYNKSPIKINKILTDNGTQFTDRFTNKEKEVSGNHAFDVKCAELKIEHRLSPPRHPQTNEMVERFNRRINEVVSQTRFANFKELKEVMANYLFLYNNSIIQKALGHITPAKALEEWRIKKPSLFKKNDDNHAGPNK